MPTPQTPIGVDVGGSGIKAALVDTSTGTATGRIRLLTPQPATPDAVAATVAELVGQLDAEGPIGCTLPAVVVGGTVRTAAHIDDGWIGTHAAAVIGRATGRQCAVVNDADAAGIAEARFGAARDRRGVVIVVTVGTGVGTALLNDGVIVANSELGHIEVNGKIADTWTSDAKRSEKHLTWEQWAERLDAYLTHLHRLLWPELIVIGGGVVKKADLFIDKLNPGCEVRVAELGNLAGIVGAGLVAATLNGVLMQLGMVGLGRMGANIVRRLQLAGHQCVVYDHDPAPGAELAAVGATPATSLADLAAELNAPRAVWLMIPAGITGKVVDELAPLLAAGDVIIDGGNSFYGDDIARSRALAEAKIDYIDCGTSGGVFGLERGYCLMIGGPDAAVTRLDPIFRTLAPGIDAASERTPGRSGEPAPEEMGYLHCGPAGAGHFVKMVHNGIEYALMAAYAEGLNILHHADVGTRTHDTDAETAPLRDPDAYQYDLDVAKVSEVWRRGSVVASWLLDLTAAALQESPTLEEFSGRVSDSGEGRWTLAAAIDEGVPAPVIATALFDRFTSQGQADFGNKILSAMRKQFGGHAEKSG